MRVNADRDSCCSSGMCALTAPDVFDQDDEDGRVRVLDAEPPQAQWAAVRDAVGLCPSQALSYDET